MTTVSSVSTANVYGYNAPASSSSAAAGQKPGQAVTQSSMAALESALASLGSGSSAPLTYNAAGVFGSPLQSTSANATPMTSAQRAQAAVIAAENAVTETLGSLFSSGASSNSSSSDISSLFVLPGTSNTNSGPFGLSQMPGASSGAAPRSAQDAILAAESAITQTLGSLASNSSSGK